MFDTDLFGEKLKTILTQTSKLMFGGVLDTTIRKIFVTEELIDRISETFICSDIHHSTVMKITRSLREGMLHQKVTANQLRQSIYNSIYDLISPLSYPIEIDSNKKPQIVIVCGLNGAGKTTTIGKMSYMLSNYNWRVAVAACDITRKAAAEQLRLFANVSDLEVISQRNSNEKAKSVAIRAISHARENNLDLLLIDTPGYTDLSDTHSTLDIRMMIDAISNIIPDAPHNVVAIVDANNGQNAAKQIIDAKPHFEINGVVITKLDTTQRAGIVVSIADQVGLPIHGIGVGPGVQDLQDFSAKEFVTGLSAINV